MGENPSRLIASVDLGTSSWTGGFQWTGSKTTHILRFPTLSYAKENEEQDAILACSPDKWYYGEDARFRRNTILFEHIKLGSMGRQPYAQLLKKAVRQAGTSSGTHLTILNLFEKIFAYIFDLLKEQSFKQPESHACSAGRTFDQVPKECRVTYPVEFNIWLRMMLCEAAKKAGFAKVAGVSEPLAAAHHIGFATTRAQFASQAIMIIDSGGGSTDAATVYFGEEEVKLVCPTEGFDGGSQMINDTVRKQLMSKFPGNQYLGDDKWWPKISREIEGHKRRFDATAVVEMEIVNEHVTMEIAEMESSFQPLLQGIVSLVRTQYTAARGNGFTPSVWVLTGGLARNSYATNYLFSEVEKLVPGIKCTTEVAAETVAHGALIYAQRPVEEITRARVDIGLSYLEDRTPSGIPLGGDRVAEAIGWVILKGVTAGTESRVELIKTVYRKGKRPNQFIASKVWTTTDKFDRNKIQPNGWNYWNCPVTYPLDGSRSKLNCLGIIEAKIPHDVLFPTWSKHDRVEARFVFAVTPEDQLLEATVSLVRDDDTLLELEKSYVSAPTWVPQSELDVERDRYGRLQRSPATAGPSSLNKKRKRGESPVESRPAAKSIPSGIRDEIPLPQPPRSIRRRRLGPSRNLGELEAAERSDRSVSL